MIGGPAARRPMVLGPALALIGALVLLASGVWMSAYVDRTYEQQRMGAVRAQAYILSSTAAAALAFGDEPAARQYLNSLRADSQIAAAGLYDASGRLFARMKRGAVQLPVMLPRGSAPLASRLDVTTPVSQDGTLLGYALLRMAPEPLARRLQRYAVVALLLTMAALLVGVLGVSQNALGHANTTLRARARDLEEQIAQREVAEAALRQAQKMDAVGQLTGGIAHDFNNLLQIVLGSLDRLRARAARRGLPLDAELDGMVEDAMRGARRAATLTQRLLAFSRRQPLVPRALDVNSLVGGMLELLGRTLGESIRIEMDPAPGVWRAMADENQLENALLNLCVNARDAMQAGGTLRIETGNAVLDEAYARAEDDDVRPGDYVLLSVADTGCGMTQDVLARVFEPFFTTKGVGEGTGLGLSQVYGFIKQSGGHLKIYSEPQHGTAVNIYLPRATEPIDGAGPVEPPAAPPPTARPRERVLVVEDEDGVRSLTVGILRELGYSVVEAAEGASALALLRGDATVGLLFTDVGLPGSLNGRQLADAARAMRPALKVLYTSGYARDAIVHHGRVDPGVALLGKPFSANDLAHRIRAVLDEV